MTSSAVSFEKSQLFGKNLQRILLWFLLVFRSYAVYGGVKKK